MPTEPDYRQLLEHALLCADSVKEFLVAISNSPQAKENAVILSMAAPTLEQVYAIENQIGALWDEFQRSASATQDSTFPDPAVLIGKSPPKR